MYVAFYPEGGLFGRQWQSLDLIERALPYLCQHPYAFNHRQPPDGFETHFEEIMGFRGGASHRLTFCKLPQAPLQRQPAPSASPKRPSSLQGGALALSILDSLRQPTPRQRTQALIPSSISP